LNVGAPIETLLVVIVFDVVALKVTPKLGAQELTVPDENDILPEIVIDEEVSANATTPKETVKSRQAIAPVQVTVYVATWSKKTLSEADGTEAPPPPPEVNDQ
jgi:hypothetical protein